MAAGLAAGVAWLVLAAIVDRLTGDLVRRAAIGGALAASALTCGVWAARGGTPVNTWGMGLAVLGLALGAWATPLDVGGRSFRALVAAAGALTLTGLALPIVPPALGAAYGWRLVSDGALVLATGSLLAASAWPGAACRRHPIAAALVLGILALVAYSAGAQQVRGDWMPRDAAMSHRLAALLAIALVAVDGDARGRPPLVAAGLFCAVVVLASAPLVAWPSPTEAGMYP